MNKDGLISAPVGVVADIATVLGVPSADLGYLCSNRHGKTNHWSRFKPLIHYNHDKGYHLLKDYEAGGTLWQADGTCGLSIPYTKTIISGDSPDKFFNGEMAWGYNAPKPNAVQPARALDFDGYYHYAIPPIDPASVPTDLYVVAGYGEHTVTLSFDTATTGTKYNLGISDIRNPLPNYENEYITEWYPGILAKNSKGQLFAKSSENKLEGDVSITISGDQEWLAGTWTMIPILTPEPIDAGISGGDEIDTTYISLDIPAFDVRIWGLGELTYGILQAYWIGDPLVSGKIGFTGTITNYSKDTKKVKITVGVGYLQNDGDFGSITNVMTQTIEDVAILPAKTTADPTYTTVCSESDADAGTLGVITFKDFVFNGPAATKPLPSGEPSSELYPYFTFVQIDNDPIPDNSYYPVEEIFEE